MDLSDPMRVAATLFALSAAIAGAWWISRAREASQDYEVALSLSAYCVFLAALAITVFEVWR